MANATLTLKISGTVNGKPIAYSKSQDVDNIDVVIRRVGKSTLATSVSTHSASATPIAEQNHDLLFIANQSSRGTLMVDLVTASPVMRVYLEPGGFFILQKADAGGNLNLSTTATTSTCIDTTDIKFGRPELYSSAAQYGVLGTYNYAS